MPRIRTWLSRAAKLLLLFLVLAAAALYALYFHRPALPAAPPHARVAPVFAPVPGMSACWMETGKTFSRFPFAFTAGSILVRHPAGDLLLDTGSSSHFYEEIRGLSFRRRFKLSLLVAQLNPETPLPDLLRRIGEDPGKLRWAIPSHVHLDHVGGLMDLPAVPVLMTREEAEFAADPKTQAMGYVIAQHAGKFPSPAAATLRFTPQPYEIFDESADLFGDGSVVLVPLRGHTPGSVGIFVNLAHGRRFFYVGDSVDDERGFLDRVGKSLMLQSSDNDPARANAIVGQLNQLHTLLPELAILPAHGRSAYRKLFPAGPLSCISAPK